MKRTNIFISLAAAAACAVLFFLYLFWNSQVHSYVKIDSGNAKASINLRTSIIGRVKLVTGAEPIKINARVLKPQIITISNPQNSNKALLTSNGPWGDISKINVENDQNIILKIGPPFTIEPKVSKRLDEVLIDFSILGCSGEKYEIPRLPDPPKVKIMDENGKILASGNFSYG